MSKFFNYLGVGVSLLAFISIFIVIFKYSEVCNPTDPDGTVYLYDWHAPLGAFGVLVSLYIGGQSFHLAQGGLQAVITIHSVFVTLGVVCMSIALAFMFQFHAKAGLDDMYSVHSWVGIFFFSLYGFQLLAGLLTFFLPVLPRLFNVPVNFIRAYHKAFGQGLIAIGAATITTGLLDRQRLGLQYGTATDFDAYDRWSNVATCLTIVAALFTAFSLTLKAPSLRDDEETKPLNPDL